MPNALGTKTIQPEALSGRAQECYEALLNYRKRQQAEHDEHSESEGTTATFSGSKIARLFSTEAAKNLSAAEWQSLMELLRHRPQNHDVKFLESKVSSLLSEFTAKETSLTGQPGDRLATPSGRADAGLGLIMHIQSKDGAIQGFWDEESPSIQTLAAKGLGFDWHHRAEGKARNRGRVLLGTGHENCPRSSSFSMTNYQKTYYNSFRFPY